MPTSSDCAHSCIAHLSRYDSGTMARAFGLVWSRSARLVGRFRQQDSNQHCAKIEWPTQVVHQRSRSCLPIALHEGEECLQTGGNQR